MWIIRREIGSWQADWNHAGKSFWGGGSVMEKNHRKNILILVTAIITCFLLFILLREVMNPKERNMFSHRIDDTILCLLDVDKDPCGVDYELPEGLTEWIAQSLEAGDWDKRLKEIAAEYKVLSTSEKKAYFTEQQAEDYAGLARYCIEEEPLLLKHHLRWQGS